jgi:hypothetical protein
LNKHINDMCNDKKIGILIYTLTDN